MPALNIWNDTALRIWIAGFADGNERTAELLCLALEKPLRAHAPALKQLKTLPPDAPGWLKQKFAAAAFHTFDPALDPELPEKIRHVRDWIAGAVTSGADWTKDKKPQRLSHFKTVDDAITAADRAMKEEALRLREFFRNNPAAFDDKNAKTVMVLEDGCRIVRLLTPQALDRESVFMGHCIGTGAYDARLKSGNYVYYSLRDAADKPHATMEVENGILLQCKGKQNVPPEERYFPALRAFIERGKLLLAENPSHTGLWLDPDNNYHSIRRLPKGAQIRGGLNLSSLHDVILPENLSVEEKLVLNGADLPALPAGLKAKSVVHAWYKNGSLHREDGPAWIERDPGTGTVTKQTWHRHGKLHRENGPAWIECAPGTGVVVREEWYRNDHFHREDGPAKIERFRETGVVTHEVWYANGQIHREGAPAAIDSHWKTGIVTSERWYSNSQRHRENAPARIDYDPETGAVTYEAWYMNDTKLSKNGPPVPVP